MPLPPPARDARAPAPPARAPPRASGAPAEEAQLDRAGRALGDVFRDEAPQGSYPAALAGAALDMLLGRRRGRDPGP